MAALIRLRDAATAAPNGSLVEIETNIAHNQLTIACGYHKNKWLSPLMELFLDCLGVRSDPNKC